MSRKIPDFQRDLIPAQQIEGDLNRSKSLGAPGTEPSPAGRASKTTE
jgi:hypothetical protein